MAVPGPREVITLPSRSRPVSRTVTSVERHPLQDPRIGGGPLAPQETGRGQDPGRGADGRGVSAFLGHAREQRRHTRIGLEPAGAFGATGKHHHVVVALQGLVEGRIGEQADAAARHHRSGLETRAHHLDAGTPQEVDDRDRFELLTALCQGHQDGGHGLSNV